jgi:hypothetical protein
MADIFISYAREDREWVEKLATQLVTEGYSVWWDWDLLVGKRYRETIETELQTAKAAVVVWSQHSIRSDFVRDEAEDAQQRNILLPLLKEIVRPPAGFRQLQTADLSNWNGGGEHIEFRRMMRGVSHLVGRPALGDTGDIHVDPAHPTTHFDPPAAPAPPVDVALILPTVPQPDSPPVTVAPEPEPMPAAVVVPSPAVAPVPPPMTAFAPTPAPAGGAPRVSTPMLVVAGAGLVAVVAIVYLAMQVFGGPSKTVPPVVPVVAKPVVHQAPLGMRPEAPPTPAPTGGDNPAPTGDDTGSDVGQGGPSAPPAATPPTPPAPPADDNAPTQNSGGDEGQAGPHH